MRKKRLVILLDCFSIGGAENMVYELIKKLDANLFDVQVLCYMKPRDTQLEKNVKELCPLIHLNQSGMVTASTIFCVIRQLRKMKPDVVHAHLGGAGFGAIWTLIFRKQLVITVHAKPEKAFSSKIEKLIRMALKSGKTKLVAVSKENSLAVKKYFQLDDSKCTCVNNGIDLDRFYLKDHEQFTLINVARQDENKNQAMLIRCFARLHSAYPDTRLLLVGDGPLHLQLMGQVNSMNLTDSVVFTGNIANTEDYYAESDVYVQTSHREAMPMSVLEAMASGLPVVSTNVGGLSDVVQDNGILVPDNDEEALYQAIYRIYKQNAQNAEEMSKASKRIVQSYSSENMAREYEKIYSE